MARTPLLFQPISFRSPSPPAIASPSPPMCQYSATDGLPSDWHVQHLGARAAGGAGIVFTEASAVTASRPHHAAATLASITMRSRRVTRASRRIITLCGAVPGIQIAHAGRKASCTRPWEGDRFIPLDRRRLASAASDGSAAFPRPRIPSPMR